MGDLIILPNTVFSKFQKIPRLSRNIIITEKIDGTNAQIVIEHKTSNINISEDSPFMDTGEYIVGAGSRNRFLTRLCDNYGFRRWVWDNKFDLLKLGIGRHFGEWWGHGIQRNYGLKEKRFSLFNTSKWYNLETRPQCCNVVPILYEGPFDTVNIDSILLRLKLQGSQAAPGYMNPEGIIIYHIAGNLLFKKTILNDDNPKSIVK